MLFNRFLPLVKNKFARVAVWSFTIEPYGDLKPTSLQASATESNPGILSPAAIAIAVTQATVGP